MKISYAIPVHNEHKELKRLLNFLIENIREEDEIVVQCDQGNTTPEVYEVLGTWQGGPLKVIEFPLNGNFANFKNNLKEHCSGDWIFQIDADEYPDIYLLDALPSKGWINWPDYQTRILQNNPKIKWISKVHEVLTGHNKYSLLPSNKEYSLWHPKEITRQEAQNKYYDTL